MISMQGVPSSLILRNESWVRQHASALARRLPSNVERADLIQVGLIAVAQAALGFEWEGDRDTDEAREAFVRYAKMRVNGAMIDELRQMDHLTRPQRRKVKVVQVARQQWQALSDARPTAADLSRLSGLSVDEIFQAESDAQCGHDVSSTSDPEDADEGAQQTAQATPQDEVEARVDTGMLMRRLESFFAGLPESERRVIDAYLGIGLTPVKLAEEMHITPSRVSQIFKSVRDRIVQHMAQPERRSVDRALASAGTRFDDLIAQREAELASLHASGAWSRRLEEVLVKQQATKSRRKPAVVATDERRR
ncbi:MAG: sigma-70 family RNA polymerase sigma factor [Rubrivivax sp.]|nr:sigma-70 family RNA polymerase sigma factor [Rubrivivax sp.]